MTAAYPAGRPHAEAPFTRAVLQLGRRLGLLMHWCPDSRRCEGDPGFPDVTAVGPGGVMFAELKLADADTTAEQDRWALMLLERSSQCAGYDCSGRGVFYRLWRPADLAAGTIEKELRQLLEPIGS